MRAAQRAALVALLALGVASCGGSKHTGTRASSGSGKPTAESFVRDADAVCTRATKVLLSPRTKDQVAYIESVVAWQHRKIDGMVRVQPPPEMRSLFKRYLVRMKARGALFDRYVKIVRAGRTPGKIDNEAGDRLSEERHLAEALELNHDCSL
jgi:hypothetical protein